MSDFSHGKIVASVGTNLVRFEIRFLGGSEVRSSVFRDKAEVRKVRGSVLMDKP